MSAPSAPCIVQSDFTILLETDHPLFERAREALCRFAELVKSPERVHTYRVTPLSLWNAVAAGCAPESILERLDELSRYPLPASLRSEVAALGRRYGQLVLRRGPDDGALWLDAAEPALLARLEGFDALRPHWTGRREGAAAEVRAHARGALKNALIKLGWPVKDVAGYAPGSPFPIPLRAECRSGEPFGLRDYQRSAAEAFLGTGDGAAQDRGNGVLALPCGAGKTVIGLAVMSRVGCRTLVLAANVTALRQWREELLDKTEVPPDAIGEYSGEAKRIRPITLASYQILIQRSARGDFPHFRLLDAEDWGLIVYDEVHLLPAPVFQITASLQARRRLGLTATLVREDGREDDVFSLIGPKRYDAPWRSLESAGWVAEAECFEVRVPMPEGLAAAHAVEGDDRRRYRLAAENPAKEGVLRSLLDRHRDDRVLVIGQYLDQLKALSRNLGLTLLTGQSSNAAREKIFRDFRDGRLARLAVSSIANVALDLPEANCAVQISGRFGSRQEEAQRLGRILRPKRGSNRATFYTLVSLDTEEQSFARHRQLFLAEQGYRYMILSADAAADPEFVPPSACAAAAAAG